MSPGIGGGQAGAALRPFFQIGQGIDDPATEFAECRPAPNHPIFFQRARRQSQEGGGFVIRIEGRGRRPAQFVTPATHGLTTGSDNRDTRRATTLQTVLGLGDSLKQGSIGIA